MIRFLGAALVLAAASFWLAGCFGGGSDDEQAPSAGPVSGAGGDRRAAASELGFPLFATRNTTRVGGADPVADAAAVALASFPSRSEDTRPRAVTLVDASDWRVAISAAQLVAEPLRAPILFTQNGALPPATSQALERLAPTGALKAGNAQVLRVGNAASVPQLRATAIEGADYATIAQAIDRLSASAAGKATREVVIAPADQPGFAMPAAGWAAKSGNPVLWVGRDTIPPATLAAIGLRKRPVIYVLGPESAISERVVEQLRDLGTTRRVSGEDPVANAIAFSRYSAGSFGWNVVDPGHGFAFASTQRPLDAAAAAPLSATGKFGPLLLLDAANGLPAPLQDYLLDLQPGYQSDPVRGVYNHGWLIGDEGAISLDVQARIDSLLEIQAVD